MNQITIRAAVHTDLDSIAEFIATMNVIPHHRCLHCDEDVASIKRSMMQLPQPPEKSFVVAEQDDTLVGVLGCDVALARGWMWGPFARVESWDEVVDDMYRELVRTLPPSVRQLDNFMDQHNLRGITALERQGFVVRGLTHVYEAHAPTKPLPNIAILGDLRAGDEHTFCTMHDAFFPGTYKDGAAILADRDAAHRVFAYYDGGVLLGYLYATPSEVEGNGYIHYVGVRADARGRGIGQKLVLSALKWMFEVRNVATVTLTVNDSLDTARGLYERTGFLLLYTGVGQRINW